MKSQTRSFTYAAAVAALYVVLTFVSSLLGLDKGVIQLRLGEILCVLPFYMGAAVPGLTIGCLLSNILTGCVPYDILFGTLATFLGALFTYLLRRLPKWIAFFPPVFFNALIIPFVLIWFYQVEDAYPFVLLCVAIGELLAIYLFGIVFSLFLDKCQPFLNNVAKKENKF